MTAFIYLDRDWMSSPGRGGSSSDERNQKSASELRREARDHESKKRAHERTRDALNAAAAFIAPLNRGVGATLAAGAAVANIQAQAEAHRAEEKRAEAEVQEERERQKRERLDEFRRELNDLFREPKFDKDYFDKVDLSDSMVA